MKKLLSVILLIVLVLACTMTASAATYKVVRINADYVRMYSAPNVLQRNLRVGEYAFVNGEHVGSMYKVITFKGDGGYVWSGFLSTVATVNSDQVYLAAGGAKVYQTPSTSARSLTLGGNTFVLCGGFRDGWAVIKNLKGAIAYIPAAHIKKVF